jgi:hypothetical protein
MSSEIEEDIQIERELLLRQSQILFPEVETWLLEIAVDAHLKNGGEKILVDEEQAKKVKDGFFQHLEYQTPAEV